MLLRSKLLMPSLALSSSPVRQAQGRLWRGSIHLVLALVLFLLLAACGDEVTEVTEVHETGMKIVEEGDELPKCTTDNEGALVYALDSAAAYACINREWTSFKGKDGRDGKDGEDGAKGEKGDQGVKGDAGKAGTSCTMKALADSSGYKVICGGDSVTVILNGEKGNKGEDGTGCSVEDTGDGFALVTCGEGENASTTKIFKGMCGETPYNPATHFCDFRDSTVYRFVTIGTQTWMAENLNFETDSSHCYNDSAKYCAKYGRYYTWADAMDSAAVFSDNAKGCGYEVQCTIKTPARGICPEGWHIPRHSEWIALVDTAMGNSPEAMQAKGFEEWPDATDALGFSALPAGSHDYDGSFYRVGSYAFFWSDFAIAGDLATMWYLSASDAIYEGTLKYLGLSVRCIKDSE